MNNINDYLRRYYEFQDEILVVYRPTSKSSWANRCDYLSEKYDAQTDYNHRTIIDNEIVIEFDNDNEQKNKELAEKTINNLRKDKIRYSLWFSGNKSYHIHFLINTKKALNIRLLKTIIMRHYTEGLGELPDLRLAVKGHLVRAEFGIHEHSQKNKTLIKKCYEYFTPSELPQIIWEKYSKLMTTSIKRRTSVSLSQLDSCNCLKYLTDVTRFRAGNDGRERAMIVLIHSLKRKYDLEEMKHYIWEWYKYSGGYKLDEAQIKSKVQWHWTRNYKIDTLIINLMEELGQESILDECPVHKKTRV